MNHILKEFRSRENRAWLKSSKMAATGGYYASFVIFGLLTAALGPTLPGLAENTRSQLAHISYIFTAQSLGYLGGSVFGGRLFDRFPGHPLLAGVLVGMAVLAFFIPITAALWLIIVIFFFLGGMQGALEVGNNTLLVWLHKDGVGPYMNALHFFFGLGAVLSPIIVVRSVAISGDFRWVYWGLALLALPISAWVARMPSPRDSDQHKTALADQSKPALVILVAVLLFLYVGAEVSYGGWVYTYIINSFTGIPVAEAALLTSAFWGAFTLGRLVSIPLAVRVKSNVVLVVDLIGCLVSLGLILVFRTSLAALWLGTLGLGIFMAAFFPTTVTLAGQRMRITGRVSGWFFVGAGAGGMILPWGIGQLIDPLGPGVVMGFILADLLLALFVLGGFLYMASPSRQSRAIEVNLSDSGGRQNAQE